MKKHKLILFLCCCLYGTLFGQNVWWLDDCIRYALSNNHYLQQLKTDQMLADNREKSIRLSWLPTLSASAGHYAGFGQSPTYNGLYIHNNAYTMLTDISFSMPVFAGLGQHWQRQTAQQATKISCLQERAFENELITNIISCYYQCVALTEKMAFSHKQVLACQHQKKTLEALFSMGKVEASALMECDARTAVCEKEAISVREQFVSTALLLCQYMGKKDTLPMVFPKKKDFPDVKEMIMPSLQETYSYALQHDANVLAAKERVEQCRHMLREQQSQLFPKVSFVAGYSNGLYAYQSIAYAPFSDQWLQNGRLSLGISFQFTLFDGVILPSAIANAKLQIKKEKQVLEEAESQLWYKIRQYYLLTVTAKEKYAACEKNYQTTVGIGNHAKANYEATKLTYYEYQNYLSLVYQAYIEQVDAWCNLLCHYQVLALCGGFFIP